DSGEIAVGAIEALDQAGTDRIAADRKHNRNGRRGALGCQRRWLATDGDKHTHAAAHQLRGHRGQKIKLTVCPAELDCNILARDEAALVQAPPKRLYEMRGILRRARTQKPYHRHRWLLPAHRERPGCRRAAEQRDERAPFDGRAHSITSSARASSIGGTSSPS